MDQDWEVVTYGKPKRVANPVTQVSNAVRNNSKVANADGDVKLKELSLESRQLIVSKRVSLGMNQVQLNQACRLPQNTIHYVEAGKQTPSQGQLNIINRCLKTSIKLV
jgi:ribosome-binding protein aMBF1 (putative translation factor)